MTTALDPTSIADYLLDNPRFFEEHAELLGRIRLSSPLLGRAISLQERQMEILREKIKAQERCMADLLRIGQENDEINSKFQAWTRTLLRTRHDAELPQALVSQLQAIFQVPQVALRLWDLAEPYQDRWFATAVAAATRAFADGLTTPFCGAAGDVEAITWLADAAAVKSVALLPLRADDTAHTFGLLVLGASDPGRFTADLGTDFLTRISTTASAALSCLIH